MNEINTAVVKVEWLSDIGDDKIQVVRYPRRLNKRDVKSKNTSFVILIRNLNSPGA